MLWSKSLLPDLQGSLQEGLCLGVFALIRVETGKIIERIGHLGGGQVRVPAPRCAKLARGEALPRRTCSARSRDWQDQRADRPLRGGQVRVLAL